MRKVIGYLLVLAMLLPLAGCNSGSSDPTDSPETDAPATDSSVTDSATDSPSAEEPDEETPEVSGEPIKIGHIVDLTGTEALTGEEAKRALEFAVEDLGGEIAGRPVEIVIGDAGGDTSVAVDQARKMVEHDGVVAIFGPTQAGQKAGVSEYMAEVGVPLIFYNGSPIELFDTNEWLVGAGGANPQVTVMANYVYDELGYRTVNTIMMDNVGFRVFIEDFLKVFEGLGGSAANQQYAPFGTADWGPYLTSLGEADAIMAWTTGSNAISLWNTWFDMGLSESMPMTAVMQSAFTDDYILQALEENNPDIAEAVLGTYAPAMYVYNSPVQENVDFVEAWIDKFGSAPANNLTGQCYQAYLVLKNAIESIDGDTAPENLIEAIFAVDFTGPAGHLFFDDSQAATKDVYIVQVVRMDDGTYNYEIVTEYKDVPPTGLGT